MNGKMHKRDPNIPLPPPILTLRPPNNKLIQTVMMGTFVDGLGFLKKT